MTIETFQPYLTYIGIGIAVIIGIVLLLWLVLAVSVLFTTQGIPQAISNFFLLIIDGEIDQAYQLTTANFQAKTSKQQFIKFIKTNKFKDYKRTILGIPTDDENSQSQLIDITLILNSGQEIPLKIGLVKQEKDWKIDQLETA